MEHYIFMWYKNKYTEGTTEKVNILIKNNAV